MVPITPNARTAAEEFGVAHNRELLTILFTDLVDSTKLQQEAGNVEAARLTELHRKIVRDELSKYDAREIEWAGDSCLAVFTKPSDAVVFALRMQAEHRHVRESESKLPLVRVGMHLGEIVVRKRNDGGKKTEDLFGLQVSEAARVMSVARGDQVFCTRAVFDNARGALKGRPIDGVGEAIWINYGAFLLKGSENPVELCEIGSADVAVFKAPETNDKVAPVMPGGVEAMRAMIPFEGDVEILPPRGVPRWVVGAITIFVAAAGLIVGLFLPTNVLRDADTQTRATPTPIPKPEPVKRYSINLSPDAPLVPTGPQEGLGLSLSPDGLLLAYVASTGPATKQIYLRRLDRVEDARPIAGTEGGGSPFFSPDNQWIGFTTSNEMKKVSVRGGSPVTLCDIDVSLGASWGDDDHIVFSSGIARGLKRISAGGGPVESLMDDAFREAHGFLVLVQPTVLPGSKHVLFSHVAGSSIDEIRVAALNVDSGDVQFLVDGAVCFGYQKTGHLLFGRSGEIMAAPFNPVTLELTGPAIPVAEENMASSQESILTDFSLSDEGTLVYRPGTEAPPKASVNRSLVWVDHDGSEEPLLAPPGAYSYVCLSPDGTRVAVLFSDDQAVQLKGDIWILDLTRKPVTRQRFTFDPQVFYQPKWTPDSQQVVFGSFQDGTFDLSSKARNGTGIAESLRTSKNMMIALSWSAGGESLIFTEIALETGRDIWSVSMNGESTARPILSERFNEDAPSISPDGRWMAYMSDESGRFEIYVRPFPNVDDDRWLVSTQGNAAWPYWAPDGRELYYLDYSTGQMMAVTIDTEPEFTLGNPRELFRGDYFTNPGRPFDLSPDGQRFLMIKDNPLAEEPAETVEPEPTTELIVVENWDKALKHPALRPEAN